MDAAIDRGVYGELVRETMPHIIRTEDENVAGVTTILRLMNKGDALSPEEREILDLMVVLVERFESEAHPIRDASPVDVLRELLESNRLKQKDLVPDVGSRDVVSKILAGKRAMSKRQARVLGDRFGVSPALFS